MENAKSQLSSRLRSARGSYQSTICSVLDGTVGKCLRKPFPACFSERERVFLKTIMTDNLQNLFKVIEDLFGSKLGQISFSDCSVFSGSRMNNPTSSIVYVVLAISSFVRHQLMQFFKNLLFVICSNKIGLSTVRALPFCVAQ